jgi:hypothetical protein
MDVVQHMLVTANISKEAEEYDKEGESVTKECMMVTTVRGNLKGYTRHKIGKAKEARRLQGMIGNPTEKELEGMVREKLLPIAQSLCKTSTMLTGFLVLILLTLGERQPLLTLGERQPGKNRSTLGWITSKSPGT